WLRPRRRRRHSTHSTRTPHAGALIGAPAARLGADQGRSDQAPATRSSEGRQRGRQSGAPAAHLGAVAGAVGAGAGAARTCGRSEVPAGAVASAGALDTHTHTRLTASEGARTWRPR